MRVVLLMVMAFVNEDLPYPFDLPSNDPNCLPDIDDVDQADAEKAVDTYHSFIGAEVIVPDAAGNRRMAKVLHRVRELDPPEGQSSNIFNDQSIYEAQFPDGEVDRLATTVIAENFFSQVDESGVQFQILHEIVEQ
jgi:hypothetical protein